MIQKKFENMNQELRLSVLEDIYTKNDQLIKDKDLKINLLEDQLVKLRTMGIVPMGQLNQELHFHYPDVEKFSFANAIQVQESGENIQLDTVPTLLIKFLPKTKSTTKKVEMEKINEWLKVRFDKDNVQVVEY